MVKRALFARGCPEEAALNVVRALADGTPARGDANHLWTFGDALSFAAHVVRLRTDASALEYIEEPLRRRPDASVGEHLGELEALAAATGMPYALGETAAELTASYAPGDNDAMLAELRAHLAHFDGCAAVVLKPALLGIERTARIAGAARGAGIAAVVTSSFDSRVGLAHAAFAGALADARADESADVPARPEHVRAVPRGHPPHDVWEARGRGGGCWTWRGSRSSSGAWSGTTSWRRWGRSEPGTGTGPTATTSWRRWGRSESGTGTGPTATTRRTRPRYPRGQSRQIGGLRHSDRGGMVRRQSKL